MAIFNSYVSHNQWVNHQILGQESPSPQPTGTAHAHCVWALRGLTLEGWAMFWNHSQRPSPVTKASQTFSATFSETSLNLTRRLHQYTPELFWAEDPISFRWWGKNIVKYVGLVLFAYRNYILQHGENCVNTSVFARRWHKNTVNTVIFATRRKLLYFV